jgi:hypothetical protein
LGAATQKVTDIGSRPALGGSVADRFDHPLGDVEVGQLQDEPVAHLPGELRAFGPYAATHTST